MLLALPCRAADVIGVLAVGDPPGPSPELAELAGRLRTALGAQLPGVLEADALRMRMAGRAATSSLVELDRAYAGALAAHGAGEFEASVRTLRAIADALEALPEGPEAFAQWTRAVLRLARGEQELGRRVEAQAVIERLLRAAPELRPEPRLYPPSFVALVDETRERLRSLGTRRLTVEAHPQARVFVEGREVGSSPVAVDLPPGRYRVALHVGAVRAPVLVVDLSAEDRTVRSDLSLVETFRPDAGPGLALPAAERPLGIVAASGHLALDRAVTTTLVRDGEVVHLVATVHDVRRGVAEREGRLRLAGGVPPNGGLEALAAFLATGRASALVSTAAGPTLALEARPERVLPPVPMPPGHGPAAAYRTAAFGSAVATVAAAIATVHFARAADTRYRDARDMLDPSGGVQGSLTPSQYNAVVREGDAQRRNAILLGIATGAGLAATSVLSWLAWYAPAEAPAHR